MHSIFCFLFVRGRKIDRCSRLQKPTPFHLLEICVFSPRTLSLSFFFFLRCCWWLAGLAEQHDLVCATLCNMRDEIQPHVLAHADAHVEKTPPEAPYLNLQVLTLLARNTAQRIAPAIGACVRLCGACVYARASSFVSSPFPPFFFPSPGNANSPVHVASLLCAYACACACFSIALFARACS